MVIEQYRCLIDVYATGEKGGRRTRWGHGPDDPAVKEGTHLESPLVISALSLERSRHRKAMAMIARVLGNFGPAARQAVPGLIRCGSLDSADLPIVIEAAVKIDAVEAIRACERLVRQKEGFHPDRLCRVGFLVGRLGEDGGDRARQEALRVLAAMPAAADQNPTATHEVSRWRGLLDPSLVVFEPGRKARPRRKRK
jgi:hypothetical protein